MLVQRVQQLCRGRTHHSCQLLQEDVWLTFVLFCWDAADTGPGNDARFTMEAFLALAGHDPCSDPAEVHREAAQHDDRCGRGLGGEGPWLLCLCPSVAIQLFVIC